MDSCQHKFEDQFFFALTAFEATYLEHPAASSAPQRETVKKTRPRFGPEIGKLLVLGDLLTLGVETSKERGNPSLPQNKLLVRKFHLFK